MEAWVSNYLHFRPRKGVDAYQPEYYAAQIFWLAVIARGVSSLIDRERVADNPRVERVCRWALATMLRVADFKLLQPSPGVYLDQIRNAQKRLEGLLT